MTRNIHGDFEVKMAENPHGSSAVLLKWLFYLAFAAALAAGFAAYFHPSFRVELANFWAMCAAALR
jgi:hypothetical protein